MTLLMPSVLGVLWHTVWVWVDVGEAWVSLLFLVLVVGFLAGVESLVRALAWSWAYDNVGSSGLGAARWLRRLLPGSGRGDGSNLATAAWADAEPVLWILVAVASWAVVQFVTEMTDDVVAKIVFLAVGLTFLGLDVLTGAWGDIVRLGGDDGAEGAGSGASGAIGGAARAARAVEDAVASRHLTASLPLPPMLGGGSGDKLTFKLDL